jgi:hypothetical protein
MSNTAPTNTMGLPVILAVVLATAEYHDEVFMGRI